MIVKSTPVIILVLLVAANGKPSWKAKKNWKKENAMPLEDPVCSRDNPADVMFVFDSFDLGAWKTDKIQEYIGSVVDELNVDDDMIKVGVVSRNCHGGNKELGEYSDSDEFAKQLQNNESFEFSHVIHKMRRHSFTLEHGGRPAARRIAVVFVDNELEAPEKVFSELKMAKDGDIEVFVVAIGDDTDLAEVKAMATSPDHVIEISDYDAMQDTFSHLVNTLCAGTVQH